MKLLKATFNRLNLTQKPVRYPLTTVRIPELFQCLSEMPLRDSIEDAHGDIDMLADAIEEDGTFIYDYGVMESTTLPGIDVGEVHSFEFLVELEPVTAYNKRDTQMVIRGFVEGDSNDPYAKYHITSTMTYRHHEGIGETHLANSTLFCQSADKDDRTLRTTDGVNTYINRIDNDKVDVETIIDTRSSFYTGVQAFDAIEVSRSHYLSRIISALLLADNEFIDNALFDASHYHTIVAERLKFPNVAFHPIVKELRDRNDGCHRTMCLSGIGLKELFGSAGVTVFNGAIKIRPVADAWDNSVESKAAYTIFQYLHGEIANLGVETLELEIDEDGPVNPKYTTFKGMDKGPQTYADIYKVAEDIHEQFACKGLRVTANINFNINGVSTVEVTVDGAPERILEYPSFASSYCNPLVTKDSSKQDLLAETYITIREIIS